MTKSYRTILDNPRQIGTEYIGQNGERVEIPST
jgi:hypothetical protein